MVTLHCFDFFDPKTGVPPDEFFGRFRDITTRARNILKARTSENIVAISDVVSWLLSQKLLQERALKELEAIAILEDAEVSEDKGNYFTIFDEAKELLYCYENIELDFVNDVEYLTWPEVFATHALSFVSDSVARIEWVNKREGQAVEGTLAAFLGADALDALECVCIAESLSRQDDARREVKKEISTSRQKQGKRMKITYMPAPWLSKAHPTLPSIACF